MKKRFFLGLCALCLLSLCLFACEGGTEGPAADPPSPPDAPGEEESYTSLSCREYTAFHTLSFGKEGGAYALSLALPTDWEAVSDERGVAFYLDGEAVARIEARTSIDNAYTRVDERLLAGDGFDIDVLVEKKGEKEAVSYRRVIRFWYAEGEEEQPLTLTADYTALSDEGVSQVINEAALRPAAAHGVLSLAEKEREEGLRLLILGNSFIGTSQVGSLLDTMCLADGRQVTVRAISRGYAQVNTYVTDAALMAEIRSGEYDAVFQCGFYGMEQKTHLAKMKEACDASGTALVLFPAHNENAGTLAAVREAYPDLLYLDWKSEVQTFIDGGATLWDFCVDDSHRHSTPLAGYVGAHMIYRALFGEAPTTIPTFFLNDRWVGEEFVTEVLGEAYLTAPTYPVFGDSILLP